MIQQPKKIELAVWTEYVALLRRYGWEIYLCSLFLALVAVVGIALLPDVYQATTTILVDPQKIPERYVASTVSADPNERLSALTQEVLSTTRLQTIIDELNLYPEMRKTRSREEVLEQMRNKITIQLKQGSGPALSTFSITFEGDNPNMVANVANRLASTFIEWNVKTREQQVAGTTEFLEDQLRQAKASLEEQEQKYREFKMRHPGELPSEVTGNLQALSHLQVQLQANIDALNRLDSERVLLSRTKGSEPADTVAPTERGRLLSEKQQLESQISDLTRRYTSAYPDVVTLTDRLARVNKRLGELPPAPATAADMSGTELRMALLDKEGNRLKQQQANIQKQISMYQGKVDAAPVREQELAEVTRNYEMSKQHYQSLLDKTMSASMAEDLERKQKGERFTILDPARVPERPYKPKRLVMMLVAIVGSFVFSIGTAIGLHTISPMIKSERELKELLPDPSLLLAMIPVISTEEDRRRHRKFVVSALAGSILALIVVAGVLIKVHPVF